MRQSMPLLLSLVLSLWGYHAWAQVAYGVGTNGASNRLFSVNPMTDAATNLCALGIASAANGVSPVDGMVY